MPQIGEPIIVFLRDTVTGVKKEYAIDGYFENGLFNPFPWQKGSFSCDCNRSIFLWGMDERELPCGDGRIAIDKIVQVRTGGTVYQEPVAP